MYNKSDCLNKQYLYSLPVSIIFFNKTDNIANHYFTKDNRDSKFHYRPIPTNYWITIDIFKQHFMYSKMASFIIFMYFDILWVILYFIFLLVISWTAMWVIYIEMENYTDKCRSLTHRFTTFFR